MKAQVTHNGRLKTVSIEYGYTITGVYIKHVWLRDVDIKHIIPIQEVRALEALCSRLSMHDSFADRVHYFFDEFKKNMVVA